MELLLAAVALALPAPIALEPLHPVREPLRRAAATLRAIVRSLESVRPPAPARAPEL